MKLIINAGEIAKLVKAVIASGAAMDAAIQVASVQACGHAVLHGDTLCATKLLQAFPVGARKAAFTAFMESVGPLQHQSKAGVESFAFKDNADKFVRQAGKDATDEQKAAIIVSIEAYMDTINESKWTTFKPEKVTSIYDVQDAVTAMLKRAAKEVALQTDTPDVQAKNKLLLAKLNLAVAAYHAELYQNHGAAA
jgi:hypothetical protein